MCTTPNDLMVEYYTQRASGGLLITEATAISEAGCGWRNAPHIRTQENVEGWKKVVDSVHAKEGVIFMQLWHMGRQSHSSHHPSTNKTFAPSPIAMSNGKVKTVNSEEADPEVPSELTVDEIKATIEDYVNAAKLAKQAGFDGIEIHGANGYLIDTFLQSSTNTRTDNYGGSLDNRVRFLREIFEAIVGSGAYPANRIGFRFSPNGGFGDMGSDDNDVAFPYFAKVMNDYKPAYLHVMDGLGFGFHNKCNAVTVADFRKVFDGPIMCNVGLNKDTAEGMVRSGAVDLCAFGRLYISNPDLVERFTHNWPVEPEAAYEHWWGPTGAKGYTDFPEYDGPQKAVSAESQ